MILDTIQLNQDIQNILETGHQYVRMEDIMNILQINKKGLFLGLLEQFHIYANTKYDQRHL
jgi:hypothetical protein